MTHLTRREFIGAAVAAAVAASGVKINAQPAVNYYSGGQKGLWDIYYYDNLTPCAMTERITKDELAASGMTGFIFPTGKPKTTSVVNAKMDVNSAKKLLPTFKCFFSIPVGNVIDGLVGKDKWQLWEAYVKNHQRWYWNAMESGQANMGFCYDTEGDAWTDGTVASGEKARAFGQYLAMEFYQKMSTSELLIMHAGITDAPHEDYKYWYYFLAGVLQAFDMYGKKGKLTLMTECSYNAHQNAFGTFEKKLSDIRINIQRELSVVPTAPNIWKNTQPAISFGLWPLGVSPNKQHIRFINDAQKNLSEFKLQLSNVSKAISSAGISKIWIYGHESAWMPKYDPQCNGSGIGGTQNKGPSVDNIKEYQSALRLYRKAL